MRFRFGFDLLRALRQENRRLKVELARLSAELIRDELTGLYNARHLRQVLPERIAAARREGRELSLLFLDLDRFKEVNERHGHEAAGRVLAQVGRVLMRVIRAEDGAFRYAGDEFVVLIEGGRDLALRVGERLRASVENHEFVIGASLDSRRKAPTARVTVSLGVRTLSATDTAESILVEADRAMFEAKRRSRNAVVAA